MGLEQRLRWVFILALVYGLACGNVEDGGQRRPQRQSHQWPSQQQSALRQGSARSGSRQAGQPDSGHGMSSYGQTDYGSWVLPGGRSPVRPLLGAPRQVLQPFSLTPSSRIQVECEEAIRIVTVDRDFYGNGRTVDLSHLSLGPQACEPGPKSNAAKAIFENLLQDCSNPLQMTDEWMVYSTFLTYKPPSGFPIIRTSPAKVPIQCFYPRQGNVSSKSIQPTWIPFRTTMMSEEKLAFAMHLMDDDWSRQRPSSVFQLGQIFHIEASVDTQNHVPVILYIDSCVATLTHDPKSSPQYNIITDNGCLVDGMEPDASSAFISPRIQLNKLRFTVDAFQFLNEASGSIFITCNLRVVPDTQVPDEMNKACSYNKEMKSWIEVAGHNAICQCCSTGTCLSSAHNRAGQSGGQSRRQGLTLGRPGGLRKREVGMDSEHSQVVLGPLTVFSKVLPSPKAEFIKSSSVSEESKQVELWVLVAVISISMGVVAGVIFIAKYHGFFC